MSPSPQVGDIQLDFIPLPTAQSSAPPQPYTIPDADESAKYETSTSTPLTSTSYQHSSAPPFPEYSNGHYLGYEEQQQQPYVLPPPTSPYPASPSHPNQTSQPSYDNVTFVETKPIDLSDGKYKLSPAAGGSIFLQNLRNPRKREFWILLVIILAIIFGVLGATVWKPDSNKKDSDKSNGGGNQGTTTLSTKTTGPALSNPAPTPIKPTVLTPTALVVPTPVSVSTGPVPPPTVTEPANPDRPITTRDPPSPTTSSKPPPTGSKDEYFRCAGACTSAWSSCLSNCKSSDTAYKSCVTTCNGDFLCEVDCQNSNGCLKGCDGTLGRCNSACPSFTP
ncbi:hypothetical protein BGZ81_008722 [Podila clonocystis]|nr:hypothetical protein BGZ81_008722 [Podila clonocystis]